MFHDHGLNIEQAAIVKKYTSLPVGAVGGINSPEQVEQAIADGKIDFAIFGRQMLADPNSLRNVWTATRLRSAAA